MTENNKVSKIIHKWLQPCPDKTEVMDSIPRWDLVFKYFPVSCFHLRFLNIIFNCWINKILFKQCSFLFYFKDVAFYYDYAQYLIKKIFFQQTKKWYSKKKREKYPFLTLDYIFISECHISCTVFFLTHTSLVFPKPNHNHDYYASLKYPFSF